MTWLRSSISNFRNIGLSLSIADEVHVDLKVFVFGIGKHQIVLRPMIFKSVGTRECRKHSLQKKVKSRNATSLVCDKLIFLRKF